ncbi:interleukin-31 receptor subunit alpha isoform X1 [Aquarana catesbeiana]|uniref:interleukin-31 receptor subunit alpha isoform X1 n=1 Tax=Aquarana catesbeiana TaxID=8400 RepID=UPI003CC9BBA6
MFGTSWILVMAVKLLLADDDLLREAQIFPHVEYVQLGTSATFFCKVNSSIYTSAHLSWTLNPNITAGVQDGCLSESVRFITIQNISAVSVEIICKIPASDSYKDLPLDKIFIKTGNPPETPHNISCIYFHIRNLTCTWITGKKTRLPTIFTLSRITSLGKSVLCRTKKNFCTSFYLGDGEHLDGEYEVQVEAENNLGKAASPVIQVNTYILVKLDPPNSLRLKPFCSENPSLLLSWSRPVLAPDDMNVNCTMRYKQLPSVHWGYHHNLYMGKEEEMSYNLTGLKAFSDYTVSMRCIGNDGQIFWSNWSEDLTRRTLEKAPSHSVELWRVITNLNNARLVHLLWKEKSIVKQSGITQGFVVQWHPENSIFARQNKTTRQNEMVLDLPNKAYMISVIYYNSAGSSPSATLRIPASEEKTQSLIHNAQVFIKNNTVAMIWNVTDMRIKTYMVEWGMDSILNPCSNISFQQVENSLEWTGDKGIFEPYTRYRISVYPILEEKVEAPYISYFYVKEAAPLHGPNTTVVNLRETEATIKWDPIRQDDANGFITSFSVVYNSLNGHESVATVSSDVYEYTLQSLKPKTLYTAYVVASTQAGNTSGHRVHFTTLQYKSEDFGHVIGTIGVLVVLVVVFGIAYTRKKEMIKHLFWPDVPDPAHSSITEWSSDLVKAALLVNPEESDGVFHKGELQVLHTVYINEKAFLKDEEGRKRLSADTVRSTDSRTSQEDSSPVHYAITEFRHELLESMPLLQSTSCSMTSSCSSLVSSLGDMHSEIQETPHVLELEQLSGDILAEVNPYLKNSVNTRETIHFVNS